MKRVTALFLTGIVSCTTVVPSFAASTETIELAKYVSAWAKPSLEYAYTEGLFTAEALQEAKSPMKRAEFCEWIVRFLHTVTGKEYQATQKSPFRDCTAPAVLAAYEAGIVSGVEEGFFAPDKTVTREQMAIMLARMFHVCEIALPQETKVLPFQDIKTLRTTSQNYIAQLYSANILTGYANHTFCPFREMTIQEAMVAFTQAYKYAVTAEEAKKETEQKAELQEEAAVLPASETAEVVTEAESMEVVESVEAKEETMLQPNTAEEKEETAKSVQQTERAQTKIAGRETETVLLAGKPIFLGMTEEELQTVWGEPDRIDKTLYGLQRYIYINDYIDYFFATVDNGGNVVEVFIPGTDYVYQGVNGKGISADIENLSYVSDVDHSGVIKYDTSEIRFPLNYEGMLCGVWLQEKAFATHKDPVSTMEYTLKEQLETELLDLIQVRRVEAGQPLLTSDKKLAEVARKHSEDMAKNKYLAYNSTDGKTPFERIRARGKTFHTASEIIAKQRGDVVNVYFEWVRTAVRSKGLIDGSMQEVGIGVESNMKELYVTVDLCGQEAKK